MKEKKKLGLVPKLIIAIILGILIGQFLPEEICRIVVTLSELFSSFLTFVSPSSADHCSSCIWFYTDCRYRIVPGIYQSVSKLYECRCTGSDRCNCRCIFKPVFFYFSAGNPGYAVCGSTGIYPGTLSVFHERKTDWKQSVQWYG